MGAVLRDGQTKEERAVGAATDVFLRYGFARTTMGDIAAAAAMSRPALYLLFPSKEEVFARVVHRLNTAQLQAIRDKLPALPNLREKLLHACTTWGVHGVELTALHPDARDLFDVARPPVREMYDAFETLLVELVGPALQESALSLSPHDLARGVAYAMRGFKDTARDPTDMRRLIAAEVEVVSTALSARSA